MRDIYVKGSLNPTKVGVLRAVDTIDLQDISTDLDAGYELKIDILSLDLLSLSGP